MKIWKRTAQNRIRTLFNPVCMEYGEVHEHVICASIDYTQLQKYKKTRHSYVPQDITQDLASGH